MCNEKQPIEIVRGTTNGFVIAVTDEDGEAYELQSGEFIRFGVKQQPTDTTYIFTKTITEADSDGNYVFFITPTDTISLTFGSYWYDIGLQSSTDYFNIIPASPFEVTYNVTKWGT